MITMKRNGDIIIAGCWKVGEWEKEDLWKAYGCRNIENDKIVHYLYHAYLPNGEHIYLYTMNELREALDIRYCELLDIGFKHSKESVQGGIDLTRSNASHESYRVSELTK